MRVVHITSVHTPIDTRILFKECVSLARAGHDVHLVALRSSLGESSPAPLLEEPGLTVHLLGGPERPGRLERATRGAWTVIRFARALGADLYHLHDPELLLWASALHVTGAPVVFDMHENLPLAVRDKPWIPRAVRPVASAAVRRFERVLLRGKAVVFAEDSYKEDYAGVAPAVDVRNYPVLSDLRRETPLDGRRFNLGYVGGVSELRGCFVILDALRILKERGVEVGFECVGPISEGDRARAEAFCTAHGLGNVRFYGRLPAREAWTIIATVDVGIVVIKRIGNYVRSLPTKLLEYMGMGLPVIASDFELYRQVVGAAACGLTVDPDRPADLAEAILRLQRDPEATAAMGERGRHAAHARYSWEGEAERLIAFYDSLLPSPATRLAYRAEGVAETAPELQV